MPDESRTHLLDRALTLAGRKGDAMLAAGTPVKGWYAVLSGVVKLQSMSSEGRVSAFPGVSDGEWFGEGAVLKTEPQRYDLIALRDTVLLAGLSRQTVNGALKSMEQVGLVQLEFGRVAMLDEQALAAYTVKPSPWPRLEEDPHVGRFAL